MRRLEPGSLLTGGEFPELNLVLLDGNGRQSFAVGTEGHRAVALDVQARGHFRPVHPHDAHEAQRPDCTRSAIL